MFSVFKLLVARDTIEHNLYGYKSLLADHQRNTSDIVLSVRKDKTVLNTGHEQVLMSTSCRRVAGNLVCPFLYGHYSTW
jgi:hypothetical protein